jgi:16S rRNA (uracil1498-N3)-methyltransferase
MRAVFFEALNSNQASIELYEEQFHHLARVVRVAVGEEILVLNGAGLARTGKVEEISKKSCLIVLGKECVQSQGAHVDLACGYLKREAMEEVIRSSVELGIRNLYFFKSEYSQSRVTVTIDRTRKILVSALEQSNNFFLPQVRFLESWDDLISIALNYETIYHFSTSSQPSSCSRESKQGQTLVVIGPEGGFSSKEEDRLEEATGERIYKVVVPGAIMRAPTATCFGIGFAKSHLTK